MLTPEIFKNIREWASAIERKFKGKLRITLKEECNMFGMVAATMFDVDADRSLATHEVMEVIRLHGMAYSRESRYFFLYDKKKRFMMLQLYPHGE